MLPQIRIEDRKHVRSNSLILSYIYWGMLSKLGNRQKWLSGICCTINGLKCSWFFHSLVNFTRMTRLLLSNAWLHLVYFFRRRVWRLLLSADFSHLNGFLRTQPWHGSIKLNYLQLCLSVVRLLDVQRFYIPTHFMFFACVSFFSVASNIGNSLHHELLTSLTFKHAFVLVNFSTTISG